MMVDWISAVIEMRPDVPQVPFYDTGHWMKLAPGGEVERAQAGHLTHSGSFDSGLLVKSSNGMDLYLSGNPVKHLQGHNLYGPDDDTGLFFLAGETVREAIGLFPSPETFAMFDRPRFTRIDVTRSYRFGSNSEANAWIRDVAATARTRHGGAVLKGDTVYFGKGSEYWTFKVYNKFEEINSRKKGHRLHSNVKNQSALKVWAKGVVRFELTLKSKELQRIQQNPSLKNANKLRVWEHYNNRISWNQNAMQTQTNEITKAIESDLPNQLQAVIRLWRHGEDLREVYSKSAFYRYRKQLMTALGVDIASPPVLDAMPMHTTNLKDENWDPEPLEDFPYDVAQAKERYVGKLI